MKNELIIGFTSRVSLNPADFEKFACCDALFSVVFPQKTMSIKDELKNGALILSLSKIASVCPLAFFLAEVDDFGVKRRSVLCFEKGTLTKIADCNKVLPPYSPGFGYESFFLPKENGKIKIGLAVEKDVSDPVCLAALSSQNDAIIGLSANFFDFNGLSFTTSVAYLFRTPVCLITKNAAYAAKSNGEVVFDKPLQDGIIRLPLSSSFAVYSKKYRI